MFPFTDVLTMAQRSKCFAQGCTAINCTSKIRPQEDLIDFLTSR